MPTPLSRPLSRPQSLCGGLCALFAMIALCTTALCSTASAQAARGKKPPPEKQDLEGKVIKVESKGKAAVVTVQLDGHDGPLDLTLTPKMRVSVVAPADGSLLQPKAIVSSSTVFEANKEFFTRKFDVFLTAAAAPKAGIQAVANAGDTWQFTGVVVAVDDQSVTLNIAGAMRKLRFEEGAGVEVRVHSTDLDHIRADSMIKINGALRGDKIVANQVAVTLGSPLTLDDLTGKKEKKPRTTAKSSAKSKKGDKSASDEPAESEPDDDPFGFRKEKKKGESKTPSEGEAKPDESAGPEGDRSPKPN